MARIDTFRIAKYPGTQADRFRARVIQQYEVLKDAGLRPVQTCDGLQWYVGPLKRIGDSAGARVFTYALLQPDGDCYEMMSYINFEVALDGMAIIAGFSQGGDGRFSFMASWFHLLKTYNQDPKNFIGYRSTLLFSQFHTLQHDTKLAFVAPTAIANDGANAADAGADATDAGSNGGSGGLHGAENNDGSAHPCHGYSD